MRSVDSYELKKHLSAILSTVEHGQIVIVTRYGKAIARILSNEAAAHNEVKQAVQALANFPRTRLPKGVTLSDLIETGR